MGKCQPAKIARSEQRLLASRWKLAGGRLLMSLQHLHRSSRFRLSTCCRQMRRGTGRGAGGREWAYREERRQRVAREPADLELAAMCPFCLLPGSLTASTRTSHGGIWDRSALETQQVLRGRSTGRVVWAGFPSAPASLQVLKRKPQTEGRQRHWTSLGCMGWLGTLPSPFVGGKSIHTLPVVRVMLQ